MLITVSGILGFNQVSVIKTRSGRWLSITYASSSILGTSSLRSRRLVRAGEERASLNKRLPKCLWQICSSPKNLRKSFPLVNLVNGSNYVTQMSTTILLAYPVIAFFLRDTEKFEFQFIYFFWFLTNLFGSMYIQTCKKKANIYIYK